MVVLVVHQQIIKQQEVVQVETLHSVQLPQLVVAVVDHVLIIALSLMLVDLVDLEVVVLV
jgi:hypothetical protein